VDLTPDKQQEQILEATNALLERYAGHERAMELLPASEYDTELHARLAEAGFLEVALGDETGPLEAALITHEVARAGGTVSIGANALVAPMVLGEAVPGPVALARMPADFPLRFGTHARTVLIDAGDEALRLDVGPDDTESVSNDRAGFPLGRLKPGAIAKAKSLGAGSGEPLRNWWRVALTLETAGAMKGAVDTTVDYVGGRIQFKRPIGAFQAVQHRLAQCTVLIEASRWLGLEAAYKGAPTDVAATAAAHATGAADLVFRETHQLQGAIGFTREYKLHVWTMRLPALQRELGGPTAHRRAAVASRFCPERLGERGAGSAL
jgi:alkylation response protein AidB-like acyl-CoA dehydrogenase